MKYTIIFIILCCLLVWHPANAQVWYVNHAASGSQDGTSWTNAYTNLQPAINQASSGDTIWVAKGIYTPTEAADGISGNVRDKTFLLKDGVTIYGGFEGTENAFDDRIADSISIHVTNETILSGNINGVRAYHVVLSTGLTSFTLSGFTISDGAADSLNPLPVNGRIITQNFGGGIYNDSTTGTYNDLVIINNLSASPQLQAGGGGGMYSYKGDISIKNTTFKSNTANANGGAMENDAVNMTVTNSYFFQNNATSTDQGGGAIDNNEGSDVVFTNVTFAENTTLGSGGAVYNDNSSPIFTNAVFVNNTAQKCGGAIDADAGSNIELNNALLANNSCDEDGGGVYAWKSDPVLNDVIFKNNSAHGNGGGMYVYNTCNPKLTNVKFIENLTAGNYGGFGLERNSTAIITNAEFSGNVADGNGGGIGCEDNNGTDATLILTNVTITDNRAANGGGGYDQGTTSQVRNTVVVGNTPDNLDINSALIQYARNVVHEGSSGIMYIEDGSVNPLGVQVFAPLFEDTANKIYIPISSGPLVDKGDSSFFNNTSTPNIATVTVDLRGADRNMGNNIDIGAYEFCSQTVTPVATISVSPNSMVATGDTVVFTAVLTNAGSNPDIIWMKNDTFITNSVGATYTVIAGVDFVDGDIISVQAIGMAPCADTDVVLSNKITMNIIPIGIAKINNSHQKFTVAPNPNKGSFKLLGHFIQNRKYKIIITDVMGRIIQKESLKANANQINIKLPKTLAQGVYFLSVYPPNKSPETVHFVID